MTDLDTFKQAMRAGERRFARNPDLVEIIARGRRLRTRRRLGYAATGVLSAGALALTAVTVLGGPGVRPVLPTRPATAGSPAPAQVRATDAPTSGAAGWPTDTAPPVRSPVGGIVRTGLLVGGLPRILFFSRVDVPAAPRVRIGLNTGRLGADGLARSDMIVNDVRGSDRSRGFHQIGYAESTGPAGSATPAFGYFVGPAAEIQGVAGGRKVLARIAGWSADPSVKIFWFDPSDLRPGVRLDGITAYDADGRRL